MVVNKWAILAAVIIVGSILAVSLGGLIGLVTFFLIGVAGGVVVAVMYFGREPEHNEQVSDQSHS